MTVPPPPPRQPAAPAHAHTAAPAARGADSPWRVAYLTLGFVFVGIGAAGAVLPVLPTTPFLLLAAACWARSNERFHAWLLAHRTFGPLLAAWREHRALPSGAKGKAIALVVVTIGTSAALGVDGWLGRSLLLAVGAGLVVFLARLPVVPRERLGAARAG